MSAPEVDEAGAGGTPSAFDAAATALCNGGVVAIPTDTVYGLAVDPSRPGATDRLFELKRRPADFELPVLVASRSQAASLVDASGWGSTAEKLATAFWPGALTIVVARRPGLDWSLGGDGVTIGLRCPAHPGVRLLCEAVGPLATTSANLHGRPPCPDAATVRRVFGARVAVVVDGGNCVGSSSTVVDVTGQGPRCRRAGAVAWDDVLAVAAAPAPGSS